MFNSERGSGRHRPFRASGAEPPRAHRAFLAAAVARLRRGPRRPDDAAARRRARLRRRHRLHLLPVEVGARRRAAARRHRDARPSATCCSAPASTRPSPRREPDATVRRPRPPASASGASGSPPSTRSPRKRACCSCCMSEMSPTVITTRRGAGAARRHARSSTTPASRSPARPTPAPWPRATPWSARSCSPPPSTASCCSATSPGSTPSSSTGRGWPGASSATCCAGWGADPPPRSPPPGPHRHHGRGRHWPHRSHSPELMASSLVLALLAAGWFAWTLGEYVMHRFAMHEPRAGAWPAGSTSPTTPTATRSSRSGRSPWAGIIVVGLLIGWRRAPGHRHRLGVRLRLLRLAALLGPPPGASHRYQRWVRRHHFHHHFGHPMANHCVTWPLWDLVFGTHEVARHHPGPPPHGDGVAGRRERCRPPRARRRLRGGRAADERRRPGRRRPGRRFRQPRPLADLRRHGLGTLVA